MSVPKTVDTVRQRLNEHEEGSGRIVALFCALRAAIKQSDPKTPTAFKEFQAAYRGASGPLVDSFEEAAVKAQWAGRMEIRLLNEIELAYWPSETPGDAKARASALVRGAFEAVDMVHLSRAHVETVENAVERDLGTSPESTSVEERLSRVEAQTLVLAKAVIAISEAADTLAPTVRAVKDEM